MEDVIRCCSLGIPRVLLEEQGLCKELRRRVSVLLRKNMSEPDFARMLSKLGKAKYEMFTPGAKFNNRKARRKRPNSQGDPDPGSVEESTHISSAVADFLAEDLSSRIESAVEGFLDDYLAGVTVETESAFSEDLSHPRVQTGGATSSTHGIPVAALADAEEDMGVVATVVVHPDSFAQDGPILATAMASTESTLSQNSGAGLCWRRLCWKRLGLGLGLGLCLGLAGRGIARSYWKRLGLC